MQIKTNAPEDAKEDKARGSTGRVSRILDPVQRREIHSGSIVPRSSLSLPLSTSVSVCARDNLPERTISLMSSFNERLDAWFDAIKQPGAQNNPWMRLKLEQRRRYVRAASDSLS